jgi:hypothetical protein
VRLQIQADKAAAGIVSYSRDRSAVAGRQGFLTLRDVFLFFGLFQEIAAKNDLFVWKRDALKRHVIWGWMKIG